MCRYMFFPSRNFFHSPKRGTNFAPTRAIVPTRAFCKRWLSDFKLLSCCNFPAASRRKRRLRAKRCSPGEHKKVAIKKKKCGRERSAFTRLRRGTQGRWDRGKRKTVRFVEVNIFRS